MIMMMLFDGKQGAPSVLIKYEDLLVILPLQLSILKCQTIKYCLYSSLHMK